MNANPNDTYVELLARCLLGDKVTTRNADCRRVIGVKYVFAATPLIAVRQTAWKTALRELEGFLKGSNHVSELHESVRPWWVQQSQPGGYMPNSYGDQLRWYAGYDAAMFDQVKYLLDGVTNHPYSRRNVITTWNTADMASPETIVTTCWGTVIQAFVDPENALHVVTYQRSADVVVGLPHNWLQMWAFLTWLAARAGRTVGTLTWIGGDCHVYECHVPLAQRIVNAGPCTSPGLRYAPSSPDFVADDFTLDGDYVPLIRERAEMVL